MRTHILILFLFFLIPIKAQAGETNISVHYAQALSAANSFLGAWANRDPDSGKRLISHNLQSKIIKLKQEDWFKQYMTGLSNPHHLSFEISQGKKINSKQISFTVILYEHYSGEPDAFAYKSKIELIKEEAAWKVNTLPVTSDNEQ